MKHLFSARRLKERALLIAVAITTVVIIGLGVMQYRWSQEVSEAAAVRLADTLQMSMVNWQIDLMRNFSGITVAMRPDGDYERQLAEWRAIATYPGMVSRVSTKTLPASPDDPGWLFDPVIPALLRPIAHQNRWLVIDIDASVLRTRILPDLAHRYFQGTDGLDYEVALAAIQAGRGRDVLYSSDRGFGDVAVPDADGTLQLFGGAAGDKPLRVFHKTTREEHALAAMQWFPVVQPAGGPLSWELIVRHRRGGPLGAFVADTHRRDLMLSTSALILLLASIVMLAITSTRAQRLASLQMDFVTAVSHELRTPLAVISSAADNIAQGVVEEPQQIQQYGAVIGNQVSQLSALVEQILQFATHRRSPQRFTMTPLDVNDIINATLSSTEGLIRAAHFTIERDVEPDLPPVMGDLVALSQCLQNLVTNALKYGRDQRWIGIHARLTTDTAVPEVQITVTDRGIGIPSSEIPRIFEPFYRSPSATSAQIHGTGLGLALAKGIAEAMGGRLTVTSDPGRGSTFSVHLPVADAPAAGSHAPIATSAAQHS